MLNIIIASQLCVRKGPVEMPSSTPLLLCYEGFYPRVQRKSLCFVTLCAGDWCVLCPVPLVTMTWPLLAGRISVNDWAAAMESVLQLELPWRMLRSQLAQTNPDGEVDFMSCFYDLKMGQPIKEVKRKTPPCSSWRNNFWCNWSTRQWFGPSSRHLHLN